MTTWPGFPDYDLADWSLVPEHLHGGLRRHLERGGGCGSFLTSVLKNDFYEACIRADDISAAALPSIARFLYNYAPRDSWGSPENYGAWRQRGGMLGRPAEAT